MFFIFLILIDQTVKYLIRFYGGFYICNPDISFSIKIPLILFWFLWLLLMGILSYSYILIKKSGTVSSKMQIISMTPILSGAVSNAIDRLRDGCVIDFINLKIWPIFNLADIFISIGAMMLAIVIFKNRRL